MLKLQKSKLSPLLLLSCSLLLAGTALCGCDAHSAPDNKAPGKPSLTPTGPELVLQPSKAQSLHAVSPGATRFEWTLQGEGKLSPGDGDTVLYNAPDHGGAIALVTVVGHNPEGASPQTSISISTSAPPAVRLDALGIPAGWMAGGDRGPSDIINLSASSAGCHTGADCIQFRYRLGATFAGILWWPKACGPRGSSEDWRRAKECSCAINVLKAGKFRAVNRVSFWARGERGGEVVEFKVGDDTLCPQPGRSSGPLTLTAEWRQYDIDLADLDMKRAVALFTWVATDLHNPRGATFYLDDVQFDGTR